MPIGQVNHHSATTEQLFERLGWFYTTAKQMTSFNADGYPHRISNLIHLLRGCIPFPTSFALRYNYDQKVSFIRSLTVQDICLTYKYWINLGRLPESMSDQLDSRGQWPYLSMEGPPLRINLIESSSTLNQLKKFPIFLLDTWNQRIGQILETVIRSLPPQSSNTLSYLFQLQRVEIVLQNALTER
jgi:hypothetical protein